MTGRARFYAELPPVPMVPGDLDAAKAHHAAIVALLARDEGTPKAEPARLTRVERKTLQRLGNRWRHRSRGKDKRWNAYGDKPGRLPAEIEEALRPPPLPGWERRLARGETGRKQRGMV